MQSRLEMLLYEEQLFMKFGGQPQSILAGFLFGLIFPGHQLFFLLDFQPIFCLHFLNVLQREVFFLFCCRFAGRFWWALTIHGAYDHVWAKFLAEGTDAFWCLCLRPESYNLELFEVLELPLLVRVGPSFFFNIFVQLLPPTLRFRILPSNENLLDRRKLGLWRIFRCTSLLFRDHAQVFGFFHAEDILLSGLKIIYEALPPALLTVLIPAKVAAATWDLDGGPDVRAIRIFLGRSGLSRIRNDQRFPMLNLVWWLVFVRWLTERALIHRILRSLTRIIIVRRQFALVATLVHRLVIPAHHGF